MRRIMMFVAAASLVLLALAPAPATAKEDPGTTGPYTGVVTQDATNSHLYDDHITMDCILPVTYIVTLTYQPASDTLGLTANGVSATGVGGQAIVTFVAACSLTFTILVSGIDVAVAAGYAVTVTTGPAGG
jgi:hypothetical protein